MKRHPSRRLSPECGVQSDPAPSPFSYTYCAGSRFAAGNPPQNPVGDEEERQFPAIAPVRVAASPPLEIGPGGPDGPSKFLIPGSTREDVSRDTSQPAKSRKGSQSQEEKETWTTWTCWTRPVQLARLAVTGRGHNIAYPSAGQDPVLGTKSPISEPSEVSTPQVTPLNIRVTNLVPKAVFRPKWGYVPHLPHMPQEASP